MNSHQQWHKRMKADLVVAGMAERTQEAYRRAVRQLGRFHTGRSPEEFSRCEVRRSDVRRDH